MKFANDDAEANVLGIHRAPDREGSSARDDECSPFVAAWLIVTQSGSRYVVGLDADGVVGALADLLASLGTGLADDAAVLALTVPGRPVARRTGTAPPA